ncbi:hypothetical protein Tsubulata_016851 [Turnera subulata]|uniref:Ribosome silencing factor n=1 Tax=Turnera subulata TaxID=218843 RepID=A0A9Q0JF45_9ROSI|nr:hypothetical protein Tsubulata_016851 [Turnera subulata]
MLAALRSRSSNISPAAASFSLLLNQSLKHNSCLSASNRAFSSPTTTEESQNQHILDLPEILKVLNKVRADDVRVFPAGKHAEWADYLVIASGRSDWHVKNIASALTFQAKQGQRGAKRMLLPSVEGRKGGKWIVIDSGKVIVHALEEDARAYYNLEELWGSDAQKEESDQDLENPFVKIRPKNNSKKRVHKKA